MQIKWIFAGYRSGWTPVQDRDEAIRVIAQADNHGVAFNDYGIPQIKNNFDVELSGWTQQDYDYIVAALGCVKARQ